MSFDTTNATYLLKACCLFRTRPARAQDFQNGAIAGRGRAGAGAGVGAGTAAAAARGRRRLIFSLKGTGILLRFNIFKC
jgi:hypothetical protein